MRTWSFLIGAILAVSITSSSAQSGLALASLTVPDAKLPESCKLQPYVPPTTQVVREGTTTAIRPNSGNSQPFPSNPWSGTDGKLVTVVRGGIDPTTGAKPLPDVPMPGSRQPAVSSTQRVDDVLQAYHAAYASSDGYGIHVYAVTFNDAKLAAAPESVSAMLNPPPEFSRRIVRGATAIRVSAHTPTECFKTVLAYVESLR